MLHLLPGQIGHIAIIIAFVASLQAAIGFTIMTQKPLLKEQWRKFSTGFYYLHFLALISVIVSLFYIIYSQYYEYHYAWEHSSLELPVYYMISCFWEGQEGSFLLWIFWNSIIGLVLLHANKFWQTPVMAILCFVQLFLTSMILGVVFLDLKIGSSPFILLKDFMMDAPIFKSNPNFVPKDGTGLNPLLQNYWMVIHPPTLFLGFATTLVPFAYSLAGLWLGKYKEWIRPALPWALFSALILGIGILMGAYWAYETLNFGGYWNWDPVENAVYVPWLVLVAAIHGMIIFNNRKASLRTTIILSLSVFLLILYSTFLTRSGILGNASVHSFTDLGLSGQLLTYLLSFVLATIGILAYRWKSIPSQKEETSLYSREFWMFLGILVLLLAAFQVLLMTSVPVFNTISKALGFEQQWAPPADAPKFYSDWQIWFSMLIALLSGIGQYVYWIKIDKNKLLDSLYIPFVISLILAAIAVLVFDVREIPYILFLFFSIFSLVANCIMLFTIIQKNTSLSGGALSHIGVALMMIGVLFSSGYSKVVSLNKSGLLYSKDFSTDMNRDNILLFYNETQKMAQYKVTYKGLRMEAANANSFINPADINLLEIKNTATANKDIFKKEEKIFTKGDTIKILAENSFYEIEFEDTTGGKFTLFPRAQVNPQMGLLASPDIKHSLGFDLYAHVSSIPDPVEDKKWKDAEKQVVSIKDTFFIGDYIAVLDKMEGLKAVENVVLGPEDVAVKAHIRLLTQKGEELLHPVFVIKDKMLGLIPDQRNDLGIKISFSFIDPEKEQFTFSSQIAQKEWVILKAMKKPGINLLWSGAFILVVGISLAINRRYREFKLGRDKNTEINLYK